MYEHLKKTLCISHFNCHSHINNTSDFNHCLIENDCAALFEEHDVTEVY